MEVGFVVGVTCIDSICNLDIKILIHELSVLGCIIIFIIIVLENKIILYIWGIVFSWNNFDNHTRTIITASEIKFVQEQIKIF